MLAIADLSAAETKKISAKELVQNGFGLADDASMPLAKVDLTKGGFSGSVITDRSLPAAKLVFNSITELEVGAGAITSSGLATDAVITAKIAADTVTAAKIAPSSLDRGLDKISGAIGHSNAIAAGIRSGFTYDRYGHITAAVPLVSSDLPVATKTDAGSVSVPATSGLTVSGVGVLGHANSIVAGTTNGISYDAHGHITGGGPLTAHDLPIASETALGAVRIKTGPGLHVSPAGELSHTNSGIAAGTYPKVVVDARGHVTAGLLLTAADIPSIDANKITSGTLGTARIADRGITQEKLADYAISFIQESPPSAANQHHNGMMWFQESTGQLRMWNGNSWFPVGFGRLSAENLRYCGTFDASNGQITGVTQFGTVEGFKIGDAIPTATDTRSGVYFVVAKPGNGTPVLPGATFDNGDWILCNGLSAGWIRVDTLSGGGGGGGASHFDDLLDVALTNPAAGDRLVFGAAGQWVNDKPATQAEVDAGIDTVKIITPKTLQDAVISCGTY